MQKTFPMRKGKGGVGCLLIIGIGFLLLSYFVFLVFFAGNEEDQYIWGFRDIHGKVVISPKFDSVPNLLRMDWRQFGRRIRVGDILIKMEPL